MKKSNIITCAGCAVIENGKLLLLLKRVHQHYEFPGGQVEPGETLAQAAKREVKEEAGCEVEITKYYGYSDMSFTQAKGKIYRGHVFLARLEPGETPILADSVEHEEVQWLSLNDYATLPLAPNVKEFCQKYLTEQTRHVTIRS